jgi:hypothetical protein
MAAVLMLVTACTVTTQGPEATVTAIPTVEVPTIVWHGNEIGGYVELVDALRAAGATVDPAGEVNQPFFSAVGQAISVDGGDVQVFEYPDATAAEGEAALISPDASTVGTSMVTWVADPHFYALNRVIVLYVGDDVAIVEVLNTVLGPPIAEGQAFPLEPPDTIAILSDALAAVDYNALEGLMGDPFTIGYWLSEGQALTPAEAVEQLRLNLLPAPAAASFIRDLAQFPDLGGVDPAGMLGRDAQIVDLVFSQGWGADGLGEAILTIAERADGSRYWHGIIYGNAGFAQMAEPPDTANILSGALAAADYAALEGLMGDSFTVGYWLSEGQVLTPAEAVDQLRLNLLPDPAAVTFVRDHAQFPDLGGADPAGMFGPDAMIVDMVYSQGWGADGLGEAILTIAELIYSNPGFAALSGPPLQPFSFEAAVYQNPENGFELSYPVAWRLEEQVLGSRGTGALFYTEDEAPVFTAVVYLWDPKRDLDAYLEVRRQAWSASGATLLSEAELMLSDGPRAVQSEIQGVEGQSAYFLFTEIGERYLELFSSGDPEIFAEIVRTLQFFESNM